MKRSETGRTTMKFHHLLLESRDLPSGAFDITGLTAMRANPAFAGIDGALATGPNVGIAILDSGTWGGHADLRGNFVAYYDAVLNSGTRGPVVTDPNSFTWAGNKNGDPDGHGTHVAGTAASTNPAIGVATGADIIGVRVIPAPNEKSPNTNTVLNGLNWVIANQQKYNIRVINMSLGYGGNSNTSGGSNADPAGLAQPIRQLEALGVTVVTASGNSYGNFVAAGAAYPASVSTISVASTWEDAGVGDTFPSAGGGRGDAFFAGEARTVGDRLAAYSQRSTLTNQVAAPGSTIFSTWNGAPSAAGGSPKQFSTMFGTSMASPFVAGVVALMQDAAFTASGSYLSPASVRTILRDTADVITDSNTGDNYRLAAAGGAKTDLPETGQQFRRINVQRAVQTARGNVGGGTTGSDTNHVISKAVNVAELDGNRDYTLRGNVGIDGTTEIGNNDVDLFRIVLRSPGTLNASTAQPAGGKEFDSYIRVFNTAGAQLAFNDDRFGLYSGLVTNLAAGTYFVGVSSFSNAGYDVNSGANRANGGTRGDYNLVLNLANPDPNGVFTGAVELATAEGVEPTFDPSFNLFDDFSDPTITGKAGFLTGGTIGSDPPPIDGSSPNRVQVGPGDVDMFRYVAPDNGRLFVRTASQGQLFLPFGPSGEPSFDTYLRIFDANGNQIAFDDDGGFGNDSQIVLSSVTKGQVFYLGVSSFTNATYDQRNPVGRPQNGSGGYYEIFATFDNGDINGTAYSAATLPSIGSAAGGTIGTDFGGPLIGVDGSLDVDFVRVAIPTDGIFRVTANGVDGFQPTVDIWGFTFDSSKQITGFSKIATSTQAKSVVLTRVQAGQTYFMSITGHGNGGFNYYMSATGTGGKTGSYTLNTELLPLNAGDTIRDKGITGGRPPRIITLGGSIEETTGSDFGVDGSQYIIETLSNGVITYGEGDIDTFKYEATTTGPVRFRAAASSELGGASDPVLRVFDAAGNQLGVNDDASDRTRDAEVVLNVVAGQTYYMGVTGYSDSATDYDPMTGTGPASLATAANGAFMISVTDATLPLVPIRPAVATQFAVGRDAGGVSTVTLRNADNSVRFELTPFGPTFTGGIRTAAADFTGDGVADLVVASGPGIAGQVIIFDGVSKAEIFRLTPFGNTFIRGVVVSAGDMTGDGKAELVITAERGGGARVRIFTPTVTGIVQKADFIALIGGDGKADNNFRGGARATIGDINGDGFGDLIFAAGAGGGPRIAIFDGKMLGDGGGPKIGGDFFAFEEGLRNGTYVSAGDFNGDGFAEIVAGAGPGGGPRVSLFNGVDLAANKRTRIRDFFAGNTNNRSGVRVAVKRLNGDSIDDLLIGAGGGSSSFTAYSGSTLLAGAVGDPAPGNLFNSDAFPGFTGGVFVG